MNFFLIFAFIIVLILLIWNIIVKRITLFDKIYFNKDTYEQVVVIEKDFFNVTLSFRDRDPERISLFDFLLNYTDGI